MLAKCLKKGSKDSPHCKVSLLNWQNTGQECHFTAVSVAFQLLCQVPKSLNRCERRQEESRTRLMPDLSAARASWPGGNSRGASVSIKVSAASTALALMVFSLCSLPVLVSLPRSWLKCESAKSCKAAMFDVVFAAAIAWHQSASGFPVCQREALVACLNHVELTIMKPCRGL